MTRSIHPVILSGGSGSRLWPMSRATRPKQFLPLCGGQPMIIDTAERVRGENYAPPTVICNDDHRFLVAETFRAAGIAPRRIILEPVGRNTALAAAVAALSVASDAPDGILLMMPSDHLIGDPAAFHAAVARALPAAEAGRLVAFGITPTRAHTGYGYIEQGDPLPGQAGVRAIRRFVEKPDHDTAARLVADPAYCWNAGFFLFRAQTLVDEMAALAPDILEAARRALDDAQVDLDFLRLDADAMAAAPSAAIDTAVMERTARGAVVAASMGWSDIGSWASLWEVGARDADGNVASGDTLLRDARNTLVSSAEGMVAAVVGVEDLIVVATADAVLVTARAQAERVKELVAELERRGEREHLAPNTVHRPWGTYRVLEQGAGHTVRRISVRPGGALSLQYHNRRAEHWVVVEGEAVITRGGETFVLRQYESTHIPIGKPHRLENHGPAPLIVIEVQSGQVLSEDDVVRLDERGGAEPLSTLVPKADAS